MIDSLLPLRAEVMHSRFSGEAMWFSLESASGMEYENHTSFLSRGDLVYYPGTIHKNGILIAYGGSMFMSKVGILAGNHFASITEDLDRLADMGMRLLSEGAKPVRIEREDDG
jgi:hypothetical protein